MGQVIKVFPSNVLNKVTARLCSAIVLLLQEIVDNTLALRFELLCLLLHHGEALYELLVGLVSLTAKVSHLFLEPVIIGDLVNFLLNHDVLFLV